jgi:hypothetical protein
VCGSKSALPSNDTVEQVFKRLETEATMLFEQLDLSFLTDYPVFVPDLRGRTRVHEPPELLKGVLHCFYNDIDGPLPMARKLHNEDVWRQRGFECPPARRTLPRFITDFELVAKDVFIELVHELADRCRSTSSCASMGQISRLITVIKTLTGTTITQKTTTTATVAVSSPQHTIPRSQQRSLQRGKSMRRFHAGSLMTQSSIY